MGKSIIQVKNYAFALDVINLSEYLKKKHEYIFANQILKSGTSIGANITEALAAQL